MTKKINYDSLVDQALRNVVFEVLKNLETDHETYASQYYITIDTNHESVIIPKNLSIKSKFLAIKELKNKKFLMCFLR